MAPLRKANLIRQDFDDVHEAGEAAISPLLSTDQDYGLSYGFDFLWRGMLAVPAVAEHAEELICGRPFGPECLYRPASDEDLARVLAALTHGFSVARQRGLGLLLVDFRE